jgi:hypothetical protein
MTPEPAPATTRKASASLAMGADRGIWVRDDRMVWGPAFTALGFRAWYLVCRRGEIVAVPQPYWFAITSVGLSAVAMTWGLFGVALAHATLRRESRVVETLLATPETLLRQLRGALVIPIAQLRAMELRRPKLTSPELVLDRVGEQPRRFGMTRRAQAGELHEDLELRYPDLFGQAQRTQPATRRMSASPAR